MLIACCSRSRRLFRIGRDLIKKGKAKCLARIRLPCERRQGHVTRKGLYREVEEVDGQLAVAAFAHLLGH